MDKKYGKIIEKKRKDGTTFVCQIYELKKKD